MRQHNTATGTITYPDEVCYTFSPLGVRVKDSSSSFTQMVVSVYSSTGELFAKMRLSPYQGSATAQLSGVMQAMFDVSGNKLTYLSATPSPYAKRVRIEIEYAGASFSFTTLVVWGGAYPYGVRNEKPTTIYRAYGYPLIATALLRAGESVAGYTASEVSLVNFPVGDSATSIDVGGVTIPIVDLPPACGDACYLRWVDGEGNVCHYLFEKGKVQYKTKDYGEVISSQPLLPEYENDIYVASRQQGKTADVSVELYAALVDKATRGYLSSLLTSAIVDMYDSENDAWIAVDVSAGTTTLTSLSYDDFVATINLPASPTQKI